MRFLCAFLLALSCGQSLLQADQVVSDGIAVLVNDAIITYQDVEMHAGQVIELLMRQYRGQPDVLRQRIGEVRADATEQLIERQLILADFKTAGYQFPESIIEDAIEERVK